MLVLKWVGEVVVVVAVVDMGQGVGRGALHVDVCDE